jgi:TolB-like protein
MEDLSDGISDDISNRLSQLPQLRVMARGSTSRYKERQTDLQTAGRELGVRAIVTGRIVVRGERLMIKAELVDVSNNRLLWGEQYNPKLADILAVQIEVAKNISEKLQLKLTSEEQRRLTKSYTDNTEAFRLYTKGRYYSLKLTTEGAKKGIEQLKEAINSDPAYALAWAGLAFSYYNASTFVYSPEEAMPLAKGAAT